MPTDQMTHREGCLKPGLPQILGHQGDILERCRGCGRVRVLSVFLDDDELEPEGAAATPPAINVATGLVCRAHQETPVTAKGTGCAVCAEERTAARERRAARRRRRTDKSRSRTA